MNQTLNDPIHSIVNKLKENLFFSTLAHESLLFLAKQAHSFHYDLGEAIFNEGDSSQGLYWLQTGTLKAVKYSTSGREQILHLIKSNQTFNEIGGVSNLPNPATVFTLEPAIVWLIPQDSIKSLIQSDSNFAQQIINLLATRLRHSVSLVEDLTLQPVRIRLANLILDEAEDDVLYRPRWYTQNELAARLGTVPDVLQRALRKLDKEGLIEVSRQQIKILNREKLENL